MNLRNPATEVIQQAEARFRANGILVDPSGRGPTRLRTATFCWQDPDYVTGWSQSFSETRPGAVSFRQIGPQSEQDQVISRCPAIFQIRVEARDEEGGSRVEVDTAWWNTRRGPCKAHGDPLVGELECTYNFVGGKAHADMNGYVYRLLQGL